MKIAFFDAPMAHFRHLMGDLISGVKACGDETERVNGVYGHAYLAADVKAAVCWGWRRGAAIRAHNPRLPILVMERGYVGDRFHWTSLGWNGLNGRAVFPKAPDIARWIATGGDNHWQSWRHRAHTAAPGYALILGQVPSDMACRNANLPLLYREWHRGLIAAGYAVKFRPHPKAVRRPIGLPTNVYLQGLLADDLAGAQFTVSWNSNASVDSVLAGVPSVTLDEGAMAWAVTSHSLANPVTMPSRTEWAAQLAWCQWQPSELLDGTAWKAVKEAIP